MTNEQQIAFCITCQELNITAHHCVKILIATFGEEAVLQMEEVIKMTHYTS